MPSPAVPRGGLIEMRHSKKMKMAEGGILVAIVLVIVAAIGMEYLGTSYSIYSQDKTCLAATCGTWSECVNEIKTRQCSSICDETMTTVNTNAADRFSTIDEVTCTGVYAGRCESDWVLVGTREFSDPALPSQMLYAADFERTTTETTTETQSCSTTDCEIGETKEYTCNDGSTVPWCECDNGEWACAFSPETLCGTQNNYTLYLVGIGVLAIGGVGYIMFRRKKR